MSQNKLKMDAMNYLKLFFDSIPLSNGLSTRLETGRVFISCLCPLLLLVGCASNLDKKPVPFPLASAQSISPFSLANSGDALPVGWQTWIITRFNRNTSYKIVERDGARVLEAHADKAASGVLQEVSIEPTLYPQLSWRWQVSSLPKSADITRRGSDDSPARVIISFDGDKSKFDFEDRAAADLVKLFSGREMPYASLMYVWDNKLPVNALVDNAHSGRAKMIVVESGQANVGAWLEFKRNVVEDFKRAFNEMPGKIISVGVMTDSNATSTVVTAHYGDIALRVAD